MGNTHFPYFPTSPSPPDLRIEVGLILNDVRSVNSFNCQVLFVKAEVLLIRIEVGQSDYNRQAFIRHPCHVHQSSLARDSSKNVKLQ